MMPLEADLLPTNLNKLQIRGPCSKSASLFYGNDIKNTRGEGALQWACRANPSLFVHWSAAQYDRRS